MASFYLDHDVDVQLAAALDNLGHEAVTTSALDLARSADGAQLLLAARRGWILVTHNRDDFVVLHDAWRLWTADWKVDLQHAGILVVPHRSGDFWNPGQAAHEIDEFVSQGLPLTNELYEFRRSTGWNRR